MLGARVVDKFPGVQIKEAKKEPFIIKDRRNGLSFKTLTLEDEVYRLKNISHKGKIYSHLQKEHISTMKDFLHWLFKEPAKLKQVNISTLSLENYAIVVNRIHFLLLEQKYDMEI
ncbi:hypothetical protein LIER_34169 [Lithospermum erythrorhizon]|uniref:Calmodulin binding protein central domain-containing protein n=1 Tax=Lithospermum erythrorhizon TaxID=34254 RepID=A0AAV3S3S0_LITER